MVERIPTFIDGFDKLIEGGFPKGSITLISGIPGTGKSIFCAQALYNNALKGKKCLYLNLEQDTGRLETQMKQFGWDPKKVQKNLKIVSIDASNSDLVEYVLDEIKKLDYDMIALDSLDSITSIPLDTDKIQKMSLDKIAKSVIPTVLDVPTVGRLKLKKIFTAIAQSNATALLTSEKVENAPGLSRDTISEFLCDGIIVLDSASIGKTLNRTIEVKKMRETNIKGGKFNFQFTKIGLRAGE